MNKYTVCRYFATGNSFISLHYEYLLGATTVREIVRDTRHAIWQCLKPACMSAIGKNDWIRTADEYYERTNFANCIGAVDGKHIRMRKPNESASQFFNYKNFFTAVLMAVADADCCFISVEFGDYGSSTDSDGFKKSTFGKLLETPGFCPVMQKDFPCHLCLWVTRRPPYQSRCYGHIPKKLTCLKRIYHYRLPRARRIVECIFGILANKWRILHRPTDVKPDFCDIIRACRVLHNYVRKK